MQLTDVPYFKQDTNYTCGPTALQMVLAYYGIKQSESKLAKLLHTEVETGTAIQAMIDAVKEHNLHVYINNESSFEEIAYFLRAFKVPSIIRYIETDQNEDHYAVVVGISGETVILNDPWHGPNFTISKSAFSERWLCDKFGLCSKWLMAISPEPFPFGRQYNP